MKVSIITPVYNDPRIRHAIDSIRSQRGDQELETIVVDGGSTDETADILDEERGFIDTIVSEADEGIYHAMNKGIKQATGDVIGILNADDRYQDPKVIQTVLTAFENFETNVCYGDLVYVNDKDKVIRYWKAGDFKRRRFYFGWIPPHPTVFVKRKVYERFGVYDLDFRIAADYEFLLRVLFKQNVSATYINRILVRMATGGESNVSISNILEANWEVYQAWQKHRLRGGIHVPIIKPLRKLPQYIRSSDPKKG